MAAALREETLRYYVELATNILIEVAQGKRKTKLISYSELMDEMDGPGRGHIADTPNSHGIFPKIRSFGK